MRPTLPILPWLLLLGSCSSPPKPPTVDESTRRPANTTQAIELQSCRAELQHTRILASEAGRTAGAAAATAARLHERQQVLAALVAAAAPPPSLKVPANAVFMVRFEYGSALLDVPQGVADALLPAARSAPLIVLRGRTDGTADSPGENRIARQRAAAMRDYLVAAGVNPGRIRETFQPSGDHAADNGTAAGRRFNRRVEVEVYQALPVTATDAAPATP